MKTILGYVPSLTARLKPLVGHREKIRPMFKTEKKGHQLGGTSHLTKTPSVLLSLCIPNRHVRQSLPDGKSPGNSCQIACTANPIIIEGHETAFNGFSYQFTTGKPLKNLKPTLNYYGNGSIERMIWILEYQQPFLVRKRNRMKGFEYNSTRIE